MLSLYKGRPGDISSLTEKEINTYKLLDSTGVEYFRVEHEPADTMDICLQIEESLGAGICKNLFLCNRQQTDFYLLMMPSQKVFKTKYLSAALGTSRLSFADARYMKEYLDITPGSVSILGLMNDKENKVQLVVDNELIKEEYIGCHPCINTASLKIKRTDLFGPVLDAMNHSAVFVNLATE